MSLSTVSLNLNSEQLEVLVQDVGMDADQIYAMNNNVYRPPVSLPAYTNGHYIFFTSGSTEQQSQYITAIFGESYAENPVIKNRGLTIYAGPTAQFISPENLVKIVVPAP
ncbi:hypothetical protein FD723_39875 (plasmid) [Nostoc sp. C052]|uniref:hypothetical protein n=1 Tax=Nostoc sp. C052 TaxID=2576902 RepID=UPI0015C381B5|nr:hypothetical protein [Nostoc sp. C052]QLE46372.1 hypothetical protein FD723_39875 [Nostoc sp. C052]